MLEQTTGSSGRRGTGPLTEPGFSQGFLLHSVTDRSFGSLPLSPLACLVGDTAFPAISLTDLMALMSAPNARHRQIDSALIQWHTGIVRLTS